MQSVAIIDYGSGNLRSAARAVAEAARIAGIDARVSVTDLPETVANADHIILPGVGAFADCYAGLMQLEGMVEAMTEAVRRRGRPFLGICVGMQLLASRGLEFGETPGLDWIPGTVGHLDPRHREAAPLPPDLAGADIDWAARFDGLKIPHMGWNNLIFDQADHPVLAGIEDGSFAYFVHSFALEPELKEDLLVHTEHGRPIAAMIGRDTIVGTQFHPEKSQRVGLTLIGNFLNWRP